MMTYLNRIIDTLARLLKGCTSACGRKPGLSTFLVLALLFASYFGISFKKISLFKGLTNYSPVDDTALFSTESAFQYRYARMVAWGEKIPSVDYQAQYPEGVRTFKEFTILMELAAGYTYRLLFADSSIPFHKTYPNIPVAYLVFASCFNDT